MRVAQRCGRGEVPREREEIVVRSMKQHFPKNITNLQLAGFYIGERSKKVDRQVTELTFFFFLGLTLNGRMFLRDEPHTTGADSVYMLQNVQTYLHCTAWYFSTITKRDDQIRHRRGRISLVSTFRQMLSYCQ